MGFCVSSCPSVLQPQATPDPQHPAESSRCLALCVQGSGPASSWAPGHLGAAPRAACNHRLRRPLELLLCVLSCLRGTLAVTLLQAVQPRDGTPHTNGPLFSFCLLVAALEGRAGLRIGQDHVLVMQSTFSCMPGGRFAPVVLTRGAQ